MTWEQRFGALIELGGDEWDAAHKRLEQKWLGANRPLDRNSRDWPPAS
jgi:hypothetical protein